MSRILIIDDDRSVLHLVQASLATSGREVVTAATADDGLQAIVDEKPDVLLLDIMLPGTSGLDLFERVQQIDRRLPVIYITGVADSETAIEAMQLGAFDYIAKPLHVDRLEAVVEKAIRTRQMMSVPVALATSDSPATNGEQFVGRSPQMLNVFKSIGRVAKQNVTVLIRGESGTGKELVARALYQHSDRAEHPFMEVNCAAIPDNLLESELFGHEKGSFTGADHRRIGKFEQCSGGTIFLDEVGDMAPLVQGKILRLLQEQRFERVGGNETIQTDVRIITATNRPLERMVDNGGFRSDLFYRLNGVTITLPPLRERGDDVALLLQHYLSKTIGDLNKSEIEGLAPEALSVLTGYDWPGNVRELASVMRQAVLNASGTVIGPDALPSETFGEHAHRPSEGHDANSGFDLVGFVDRRLVEGSTDLYSEALAEMEQFLITRVLQQTGGNQSKAAETLGITRGKVRDRISTFNISLDTTVGMKPEVD